jgi:hypothetical protein
MNEEDIDDMLRIFTDRNVMKSFGFESDLISRNPIRT